MCSGLLSRSASRARNLPRPRLSSIADNERPRGGFPRARWPKTKRRTRRTRPDLAATKGKSISDGMRRRLGAPSTATVSSSASRNDRVAIVTARCCRLAHECTRALGARWAPDTNVDCLSGESPRPRRGLLPSPIARE